MPQALKTLFLIQHWAGESSVIFTPSAIWEVQRNLVKSFRAPNPNGVLQRERPLPVCAIIEHKIEIGFICAGDVTFQSMRCPIIFNTLAGLPNLLPRSNLPKTVIFLRKSPWRRSLFRAFITWHCTVGVQATRRATRFQERFTQDCFMGFSDSSCADVWFLTFPTGLG